MLSTYRRLFAAPGTAGFGAAGFAARLAHLMTTLAVVFLVSATTHSYGSAGTVAAAYALAYSAAGPMAPFPGGVPFRADGRTHGHQRIRHR